MMKRKVIKQGNGTLTITLPKGWTEKIGLKGGDEIDVEETENGVSISSEKTSRLNRIQIDSTAFNERVTRLTLSAAHKSGFDEIEVLYDNPHTLKIAYELVKELYMGFSVVEQTSKRFVLKAITHDKPDDFDTILRRGFLVALSMADSSLDMIRKRQFSDLPSLIPLEHFNNQLTNFCERLLNKKIYRNGSCSYYIVAWNLEKVCDNYKYICEDSGKAKGGVNEGILDFYSKTNQLFKGYYDVFYDFDIDKMVLLTQEGKKMIEYAKSLRTRNEFEFIMLTNLMNVVLQCMDFSASYIAIKEFVKS